MSEKIGMEPFGHSERIHEKDTGREVIIEPPYPDFEWKDGYVLVSTSDPEAGMYGGAIVGDTKYNWMPKDEVIIEE